MPLFSISTLFLFLDLGLRKKNAAYFGGMIFYGIILRYIYLGLAVLFAATATRYDGTIHGFFSLYPFLDVGKRAVGEACGSLRASFAGPRARCGGSSPRHSRPRVTCPKRWLVRFPYPRP